MGDIQTLTKQLSMLQSYMKWKNGLYLIRYDNTDMTTKLFHFYYYAGEEFNDYCKLWMSDSQQPQPAQNVQRNVLTSSGPSSVESTLNIKREIVDSAEGEIRDEQNNNCDATLVGKEVNPGSEEIGNSFFLFLFNFQKNKMCHLLLKNTSLQLFHRKILFAIMTKV